MSTCPCSRPTTGWLCRTCIAGFCDDLAKVPEIMDRLEASKVGDTPRPSNGNSGPTGSKPPVNLTPVIIQLNINNMVRAMAGHLDPRWLTFTNHRYLVNGILDGINTLAALPCIISYQAQLAAELGNAERFFHPAPPTITLGPCLECQTPLLATEEDHETRCPTCGTTYAIQAYRTLRTLQALGNDGTPIRAANAVRQLQTAGLSITTMDLKNWVSRGRIHPVDVDEHQRRLYNLQDIYLLALQTQSP